MKVFKIQPLVHSYLKQSFTHSLCSGLNQNGTANLTKNKCGSHWLTVTPSSNSKLTQKSMLWGISVVYDTLWEIHVILNCVSSTKTHFMFLFELPLPLVYLFLYWLIKFLTGTNMIRVIGKYVYIRVFIYKQYGFSETFFGSWTAFGSINQALHWFWLHFYSKRIIHCYTSDIFKQEVLCSQKSIMALLTIISYQSTTEKTKYVHELWLCFSCSKGYFCVFFIRVNVFSRQPHLYMCLILLFSVAYNLFEWIMMEII